MPIVVSCTLLHGYGMGFDLCFITQHHFVCCLAIVVKHKANGFTCLCINTVGREAHLIVHLHRDAAADQTDGRR